MRKRLSVLLTIQIETRKSWLFVCASDGDANDDDYNHLTDDDSLLQVFYFISISIDTLTLVYF